jgi:hypothetical protein
MVSVRISRTRNPDGAGPLRSVQRHTYTFDDDNLVTANTVGDAMTIDTGDRLDPYGKINMSFTADSGVTDSCQGVEHTRRGELTGTMIFKTQSSLGAFAIPSVRATVTKHDPEPEGCGHYDTDACPVAGAYLSAQGTRNFESYVAKRPGRARARVVAARERSISLPDTQVFAHVTREIRTWVPAEHARFTQDLSKAVVRGAAGTDTPGRLVFAAATEARRQGARCEGTRRFVMWSRRGTVTGSMVFDFFIGLDRDVGHRPLRGRALRFTIHHQ